MVADPDLIDEAAVPCAGWFYRHPPTNIQHQMACFPPRAALAENPSTALPLATPPSAGNAAAVPPSSAIFVVVALWRGAKHANAFGLQTPAQINTQQLTWRAAHAGGAD